MQSIFDRANAAGIPHIPDWLPNGVHDGDEYKTLNPTRSDKNIGSFSVNLTTGMWRDYATDDSGDCVGLYGYLNSMRHIDAARAILELYDPSYSPFDDFKEEKDDKKGNYWKGWRCLYKGHKSPPELDTSYFSRLWGDEVERWEMRDARSVLVAIIVRFPNVNGGKEDKPFTLWSDGKETKWRCAGIDGGKYPLYNLPDLLARPNDEFVLTEGQKVPSRLIPVIGVEYVPIGWYGGINNLQSTDFEPLRGRQGLFSFDADTAGRSVLKKLKELDVKYKPVYPPTGVAKGWDLADGLRDGWTKTELLEHLRKDAAVEVVEKMLATTRPTTLDTPPSQEVYEMAMDVIWEEYEDKEGKTKMRLADDWFMRIMNIDAQLANCIKFDYTIGTSSTAYSNSNMFEAAIDRRLSEYIGFKNVTPTIISRIIKHLEHRNRNFNRVADFIDILKQKHPDTPDDILDTFLSNALKFDIENESEMEDEDFAKYCDRVDGYYREVFDCFFLRMHVHIRGTRKGPSGEYLGLVENDIVPVLEGGQEKGKTMLCRLLAVDEDLYTDLGSSNKGVGVFGSSDTVKRVRGRMIAELGEMGIMRNSDDVNQVKSFISAKTYDIDIKFVERTAPLPCTVSFIGTSNPSEYLIDETGNRRFYPVKILDINKDWLSQNVEVIEKIHAHYARRADAMPPSERYSRMRLSKEAADFIESRRKGAMIRYADHQAIVDVVGKWWAAKSDDYERFKMCLQDHEIFKMVIDAGYSMKITHHSLQSGMVELGFEKKAKRDNLGKVKKGWWKIPPKVEGNDTPF